MSAAMQVSESPGARLSPATGMRAGRFFAALGPDAARAFDQIASLHYCEPGTLLFMEEQTPREIQFLVRGGVKLTINSSTGRRFLLRIAHAGEFLGLSSALHGSPYQTTAQATYPCTLLRARRAEFVHFLDCYPAASQAVLRELSCYYEQACARLRVVGSTFTVSTRLARLLLEWSGSGQQTEKGTRIHIPLTHGEIGECIGTCRESVTRSLNDLQRRRIVRMRGATLTVTDRPALEGRARV